MRKRTFVGAAVLLVWLAVLGWHVRRVLFPGELARLSLATRTLPPGTAYYALFSGPERAGWAQIELDTLPGGTGFRTVRRIVLELPGLGVTGNSEVRTEAWQGADLSLDSVTVLSLRRGDTTTAFARRIGDSLLARLPGGSEVRLLVEDEPVFLDATWPLRFAADGSAAAGDRYSVALFDPLAGLVRDLTLTVTERARRVWPDSADLDSLSGAWFAVREDTVDAWRLSHSSGATEEEYWVDEDGRFLGATFGGGVRMERTAFEIAFFNRPGAVSTSARDTSWSQP